MKIKANELAAEIEIELSAYSEEIQNEVLKIVKDIANKCVKRLKSTSPTQTGVYAKGWTKKLSTDPEKPSAVVYNRDRSWLAHLLEHGHKSKDGSYVAGTAHIEPAADEAQEKLFKEIVKII